MKTAYWALVAAALLPALATANQAGDVMIRAGVATVRPVSNSDNVLGLGSFDISNSTQLGLTFGYMVTDNIGVELLAATPFTHNISLNGVGTIAQVKQLPPSLMAQYYFGSKEDKLRPYVGVGLNYTSFFDAKFNDTGSAAGLSDLSVSHSWGVATQAGVDYNLNKSWTLNASVWWMNITSDVKFNAGGQQQTINTQVNPWVLMLGAGYRF
jgi:outer membrane protein